jgi:hypothetical protein
MLAETEISDQYFLRDPQDRRIRAGKVVDRESASVCSAVSPALGRRDGNEGKEHAVDPLGTAAPAPPSHTAAPTPSGAVPPALAVARPRRRDPLARRRRPPWAAGRRDRLFFAALLAFPQAIDLDNVVADAAFWPLVVGIGAL